MKVAIVVGHHEKSKGAYSDYFGMNEYDFYSRVASLLSDVTIFKHDSSISGYTSRIKNTANRINQSDFDLVIELHFNSFSNPSANGCEALFYYKSAAGKLAAEKFSQKVNECTGIPLRNNGLKPLTKGDRGFASVYYTKAPTILIEPFFGSNEEDCKMIGSVENMAQIITDFLNLLS